MCTGGMFFSLCLIMGDPKIDLALGHHHRKSEKIAALRAAVFVILEKPEGVSTAPPPHQGEG